MGSKETKWGYMGGLREGKGKEEMMSLYYNFKKVKNY